MKNNTTQIIILLFFFAISNQTISAQISTAGSSNLTTAVEFLTIAPDARGNGMATVGVASMPDMNAQFWNPSKYAFIEGNGGVSLSYLPWLNEIADDIKMLNLSGYYRMDDRQVFAASLRYFSLGDIDFVDENRNLLSIQNPNEFAVDFSYSSLLSEYLSGSVALRYIRSDLTKGQEILGVATQAGNAFAADLSFYFQKPVKLFYSDAYWTWGINISNIGTKISYGRDFDKDFIPTNLRFGTGVSFNLKSGNQFAVEMDFNKLLVPTPEAVSDNDLEGNVVTIVGQQSKRSALEGIFASFSDAPGGFSEELKEITIALGAEYIYNDLLSFRAGYHYENEIKGNRQFFAAGIGVDFSNFQIAVSYLIPTQSNHPLQNTLGLTVGYDFDE